MGQAILSRSRCQKMEASYEYMASDNPACAGSFCVRKYHPKPHDNSNILKCEAEANKLKKKVEKIKDTIAAHDNSLLVREQESYKTGLTS